MGLLLNRQELHRDEELVGYSLRIYRVSSSQDVLYTMKHPMYPSVCRGLRRLGLRALTPNASPTPPYHNQQHYTKDIVSRSTWVPLQSWNSH